MAARIPMIAMTVSSSIKVKAERALIGGVIESGGKPGVSPEPS
jgi:hypothetical protein